jgi:hypothetical protein
VNTLILLASMLAFDNPSKDVVDFFRSLGTTLAEAHQEGNAKMFLAHFDPAMPGYADFRDRIEAMTADGDVSTVIDIVNVEGDKTKQIELDWVLEFEAARPKRAVVKCTLEKRAKKWKIVALDPITFFQK